MTKFKSDYEVGQRVIIVKYDDYWGGFSEGTVHTLTRQDSPLLSGRTCVWMLDNRFIHPEEHFAPVYPLPIEDFL